MMETLKMLLNDEHHILSMKKLFNLQKNHFTNLVNLKPIFLISIEKAASSFIAAHVDLYF